VVSRHGQRLTLVLALFVCLFARPAAEPSLQGPWQFRPQVVGTTSAVETVTIKHIGPAIGLVSVQPAGGDFRIVSTCNRQAQLSDDCNVRVIFAPKTTGPKLARVVVTDGQGT